MCLLVVCIHAVSLPYRFTLLSNRDASRDARPIVSLPYRFTLLSNKKSIQNCYPEVSLPYRFTLLSNEAIENYNAKQFHYPIDLHYSQTGIKFSIQNLPFHYPIDLHYSQTLSHHRESPLSFITL